MVSKSDWYCPQYIQTQLNSLVQSFDGNGFGDGAVLGCDFVGVVVETGSDVTRITKGTTIAGLIWGGTCSDACDKRLCPEALMSG
jgi:D-arabinose 1-dehydrogenase-like Zn-dependent alcohol dehydrogenase